MRVLLDANFMMLVGQKSYDVFAELDRVLQRRHELVTTESVIRELKKLSQGTGRDARAARMALTLIDAKRVKTVKGPVGYADADLVALGKDSVVCTQDAALRKRLKDRGTAVAYLRASGVVTIEGLE